MCQWRTNENHLARFFLISCFVAGTDYLPQERIMLCYWVEGNMTPSVLLPSAIMKQDNNQQML
jgi:hypothetical protein